MPEGRALSLFVAGGSAKPGMLAACDFPCFCNCDCYDCVAGDD